MPGGTTANFRIEFYEGAGGDDPVWRWFKHELEPFTSAALGMAIKHILQVQGLGVVETRFGKALGQGLFEFRLDDTVDELLSRFGFEKKRKFANAPRRRMLLRVFFHVYGDHVVLLLGGYDRGSPKGSASSRRRSPSPESASATGSPGGGRREADRPGVRLELDG